MATRAVTILINAKDQASKALGGVSNAMGTMRERAFSLQGALIGLGIGGLARQIIGDVAELEQTTVAFKTMLGSMEAADTVLRDLKKFGAETPFEFPELADSTRKLIAFGVAQDALLPTLRNIGDVASGVGIDISELAEIYGKARVQGRLFAEDVNQLTGRGVPIIGEFARQFGVAESEVKKLVEAGKIGFPELEKAFQSMSDQGGKFFGMMKEQSQTLNGQISTLKDELREVGIELGKVFAPGLKIQAREAADAVKIIGALQRGLAGEGFTILQNPFTERIATVTERMRRGADLGPADVHAMRREIASIMTEMRPADRAAQRRMQDAMIPGMHVPYDLQRREFAGQQKQLEAMLKQSNVLLQQILNSQVQVGDKTVRAIQSNGASVDNPTGRRQDTGL